MVLTDIKPGDVNVIIIDPNSNQDLVKPKVARISDEELLVSYIPLIEGVHLVDIKCAGHPISNASFSVGIAPNNSYFSDIIKTVAANAYFHCSSILSDLHLTLKEFDGFLEC